MIEKYYPETNSIRLTHESRWDRWRRGVDEGHGPLFWLVVCVSALGMYALFWLIGALAHIFNGGL